MRGRSSSGADAQATISSASSLMSADDHVDPAAVLLGPDRHVEERLDRLDVRGRVERQVIAAEPATAGDRERQQQLIREVLADRDLRLEEVLERVECIVRDILGGVALAAVRRRDLADAARELDLGHEQVMWAFALEFADLVLRIFHSLLRARDLALRAVAR